MTDKITELMRCDECGCVYDGGRAQCPSCENDTDSLTDRLRGLNTSLRQAVWHMEQLEADIITLRADNRELQRRNAELAKERSES